MFQIFTCSLVSFAFLVGLQISTPREHLAPLPEGKQLLNRHFDYVGGKEVFVNLKSLRIVTHLSFKDTVSSEDVKIKTTLLWGKPDRLVELTETDHPLVQGTMKGSRGIHGTLGWSIGGFFNDDNAYLSPTETIARDTQQAYLHPILLYYYRPDSAKTLRLIKVEGRDCYEVECRRGKSPVFTLYFDKEHGQLVRVKDRWLMPTGVNRVEILTFSDYQTFGKIRCAALKSHESASVENQVEVLDKESSRPVNLLTSFSMTSNDVSEVELALPEKVRLLIEKEKGSAGKK